MKKTSVLLMSAAVLGSIALANPQSPVHAATETTTAVSSLQTVKQSGQVYPYYMDDPADDNYTYKDASLTIKAAGPTGTPIDATKAGNAISYDAVAKNAQGKITAYHFNQGWMAASLFATTNPYHTEITAITSAGKTTAKATVYSDAALTQSTGQTLAAGTTVSVFSQAGVYTGKIGGVSAYKIGDNQWISASVSKLVPDTKPAETKISATITAGPNGAKIYSAPYDDAGASRIVAAGSHWKAFAKVENVGSWYNLGGNQWVKGNEIDTTNTYVAKDVNISHPSAETKVNATVTIGGQGAEIYTAPRGDTGVNRVLTAGSHWKAFATVQNNGTWYNLGGNQWVQASALSSTKTNTPAPAKTTETKTNTAVVAGPNGAQIFTAPSSAKATTRILKAGSHWKTFKLVKNSEGSWYNLGGNQWVQISDVTTDTNYVAVDLTTTTGVATITYVSGYGIPVWSSYRGGTVIANKRLMHGTSWKVFGTASYNGNTWYNVGGNQWIDGHYVSFTK